MKMRIPSPRFLAAFCGIVFQVASFADEGLPKNQAPLTLLQLNDVYTALPVDDGKAGGLARVATLKKRLMAEGRKVELVICGDFLSPSVPSSIFRGRQMMEALNACGVDIGILGNHEFDFGTDVLRKRMKEAKWQWIVTNMFEEADGRPPGGAPTFLLRDYAGLKVGYLGICLTGDEISRDRRTGMRFEDPLDSARKMVTELKSKGAQVVVAITHLDYADDRRLALRCPEIDIILGGHEHVPITTHVGKTLITKSGSDARFVARIDVVPAGDGSVIEKQFELIPIGADLPDDPGTNTVARDFEDQLGHHLDVEVGRTRTPLDAVAENLRSRECNLGNLLADAMKADTKAEITILNAGSIRSNRIFPPGVLKLRDVVAIHPFGGTVCTVEGDGALVLAALNHGVGRLGESVGRFPQVSGLRFRVDPKSPAGDRVREVMVNGEPLDLKRTYKMAVGDYMVRGGDGYEMLTTAKVIVGPTAGNTLPDVLERYIRARGEVAPEVEGRIIISDKVAPVIAKKPVLLDTDMGIDSVLGLLYLLKEPGVELKGITVTHGIADTKAAAENARRILELGARRGIPVAIGASKPLKGERAFPDFWKEQASRLGGLTLPPAVTPLNAKTAADFMAEALEKSAEPVTIVAMGPLTNVALALNAKPDIAKKIKEIVAMGGAIDGPGNVDKPFVGIRNAAAEWNFYLDPHAAEIVLKSGVPLRLIPVEATKNLPVTKAFRDRVREAKRDTSSELVLGLLNAVQEGIDGGWFFFWDTMAAVASAHPEIMGNHEARIKIVTDEGPNLGQTLPADDGVSVKTGEEINLEVFEQLLLKILLD
ncbi:MAG: nucleoside hydrolase [Verrucomicrobiaceae bacterium]|nr:nucleoside hydrolase [Verrucomicrobiaceae bacterium]